MTSRQKPQTIQKTLLDLLFTLIIPLMILSPNILGSGISVAELLGTERTGNIRSYLLASLIPVIYVAWDILIKKNLSPIALFGSAGALVSGALTLWYVDGFWYATKDSMRVYLTGGLFIASAMTSMPLFKLFIDLMAMTEKEEDRELTISALDHRQVHRSLQHASLISGAGDLIYGVINSLYNYRHVTATFGSSDFNAQIAQVNAVMRVPGMIINMATYALALYLIQTGLRAVYGQEVSLFNPGTIAEARRKQRSTPLDSETPLADPEHT